MFIAGTQSSVVQTSYKMSTGTDSEDNELESLRTKLYLDLLGSMVLEDPSLQDILLDITLGSLINEMNQDKSTANLNDDQTQENSEVAGREFFKETELYAYGTPVRRHLSHFSHKKLLSEAQKTLRLITEFFYGGLKGSALPPMDTEATPLFEAIKLCEKDNLSMKEAIRTVRTRLTSLMIEIQQKRDHMDQEMKHAKTIVFPLHDAARTTSIDLLAATIEASLVKLSLTKARSERALYNHRSKQNEGQTVSQVIKAAYAAMKKEERDMKSENQKLDRQVQEYETLLQIVDGTNGGYQQLINDWTKVKQETDECMKDLRRLGWTGD